MLAAEIGLTECKQTPLRLPRRQEGMASASVTLGRRTALGQMGAAIQGSDAVHSREKTVIRPTRGPIPPRLNELWRHREIFAYLVWRDIKVRYAQTALGAAWMIFQPLAMLLVYTFAFSQIAQVVVPGVPYAIFALAGLTLWIFVSRGVVLGAQSLLSNMPLITKTSVPRILLPAAAVVSVLADFLVAFVLYLVISAAYGTYPTWRLAFAPLLFVVAFLLTLGLALWLCAMSVRYRDVAQALPFLVQLWFFLSPIAYLLQTPGHSWETVVQALNPLVGLVLAFRWSLIASPAPRGLLAVAIVVSILIFILGVVQFARTERTIADDV
jgi:lipopolysaccharide transport system permease protein